MDGGPITQRSAPEFSSNVIEKPELFAIGEYHHASFKPSGQETTLYDCGLLFNQPDTDSLLNLNSSNPNWPLKRDDSFSETRKPPNCSNGSISSENSSSSQPNNSSPSTYSPGSLDKRNKSLVGLPNNSLLEFMEGSLENMNRKRKAASEDEIDDQEFQPSVAKRQEFDFNASSRIHLHNSNTASHLLNQLQSSNQEVPSSSFPSGLSLLQSACCKVNEKACEPLAPAGEFNAFRPYGFASIDGAGRPFTDSIAPNPMGQSQQQSLEIPPTARRKNATRESTATLKAWLQEHIKNPYPTKGEKIMLAIITKMTLTQVSTWFANARRRLKKENKMTWTPKNRGEDDEDYMEEEDTNSEDQERKNEESASSTASPAAHDDDVTKNKIRGQAATGSSLLEEIPCLDSNLLWNEKQWDTGHQYHVAKGTYNPPVVTQQSSSDYARAVAGYNFGKSYATGANQCYTDRSLDSLNRSSATLPFLNPYGYSAGYNPSATTWPEYHPLSLPRTQEETQLGYQNSVYSKRDEPPLI